MKDLLLPLLHLAVTAAKLCRPGGVRAVIAENLLLKQQLIVLRRSRQRAPNLRVGDRLLCGFGALFLSPGRIRKVAIGLRPSTLLTGGRAPRCSLPRGAPPARSESSLRPRTAGGCAAESPEPPSPSILPSPWGASSPGRKVSLTSRPYVVHIRLTPHTTPTSAACSTSHRQKTYRTPGRHLLARSVRGSDLPAVFRTS